MTVSPRESLQAAIDRCRAGGSVLLLPGAYEGGVVLSKEVHLFGRGEATLRRAVGAGPVITSTAPAATLDGLIVRRGPHAKGVGHYGILITAGSLLVRRCDVSSQSRSNICVRGPSANPTILGCKLHGSIKSGIVFRGGSKGRVEGSVIVDNQVFGVQIDGSEPTIVGNKIHGAEKCGVQIAGSSAARLIRNQIWGNGESGINIFRNSDRWGPSLSNTLSGVCIANSKGRLEHNTIRRNGRAGVWVKDQGEYPRPRPQKGLRRVRRRVSLWQIRVG